MIIRPDAGDAPNLKPEYNLAPSRMIYVIRQMWGERELVKMRWGLVPNWWDKTLAELTFSTFNAKAETLRKAPSFRSAWKRGQRCIVPFNFFEWPRPKMKGQPPLYIYPKNAPFFAMAGLWDEWRDPETDPDSDERLLSCTIITVPPNDFMRQYHHRMPAILALDDVETWLSGEPDEAYALLKPCPSEWMEARRVTGYVNNVDNQGPECIEPMLELDLFS